MPKKQPVEATDTVDIGVGSGSVQKVVGVRHYPPGTPMAEVSVEVGRTVSPAPYESIRVSVRITRPAPDSDQMIEEAYCDAKDSVQDFMNDLLDELSQ